MMIAYNIIIGFIIGALSIFFGKESFNIVYNKFYYLLSFPVIFYAAIIAWATAKTRGEQIANFFLGAAIQLMSIMLTWILIFTIIGMFK